MVDGDPAQRPAALLGVQLAVPLASTTAWPTLLGRLFIRLFGATAEATERLLGEVADFGGAANHPATLLLIVAVGGPGAPAVEDSGPSPNDPA